MPIRLAGTQPFYPGKFGGGELWLLTWGLFGQDAFHCCLAVGCARHAGNIRPQREHSATREQNRGRLARAAKVNSGRHIATRVAPCVVMFPRASTGADALG